MMATENTFFLCIIPPSCNHIMICQLKMKVSRDRRCSAISYRCGLNTKHMVEQALVWRRSTAEPVETVLIGNNEHMACSASQFDSSLNL